jgi:hypothetical protein
MQKFTVFSIILSISVVLILGDIVFHDYLSAWGDDAPEVIDEVEEATPLLEDQLDDALEDETAWVELSEEIGISILRPSVDEVAFLSAGFFDPVLKDTIFSGLVFQFISFSDQVEAYIYQWNLFDGEDFVGSVYEIKYPSEMGSLQGYLNLRDRAQSDPAMGEVNETNSYGNASFYFNHATKTKTVHVVIRSGATIYALEYAYVHHEKMKSVLGFGLR